MGEPNMAKLKSSRKPPAAGDVFAMHYPSVGYVFGQVIFADLPVGPMGPGSDLIYVYKQIGKTIDDFADQDLKPESLLIRPSIINRLPWTKGYFQTVASKTLDASDTLAVHCFKDLVRATPTYVDLQGKEMAQPSEPCGVWGLDSYRIIDDLVSEALGIPRAAD